MVKTKKPKTTTKTKNTTCTSSERNESHDGGSSVVKSDISNYQDVLLVMIGDSDIAYWPDNLIPSISACERRRRSGSRRRQNDEENGDVDDDDGDRTESNDNDNGDVDNIEIIKRGKSGATLKEIIPDLLSVMEELRQRPHSKRRMIIVACAGENDIGEGISLDSSLAALHEFLDVVFSSLQSSSSSLEAHSKHLIFLGPKFEPWLDADDDRKTNLQNKQLYSKMSRNFERCCKEYNNNNNNDNNNHNTTPSSSIYYVDCLTMFCTNETKTIPGAILGGKAKADAIYFQSDQLHLNSNGYQIWKTTIEDIIINNNIV